MAQWSAIVGDSVAAQCSPERMVWPKGRDKAQRHTEGATLTVRADHGTGLALSYETPAIIDRINGFFGYHAVAKVKIVQGTRSGRGRKDVREVAVPSSDVIEHVEQKPVLSKRGPQGSAGPAGRCGSCRCSSQGQQTR